MITMASRECIYGLSRILCECIYRYTCTLGSMPGYPESENPTIDGGAVNGRVAKGPHGWTRNIFCYSATVH